MDTSTQNDGSSNVASEIISRLLTKLNLTSERALGRELGVGPTSVNNWKQRDTIPIRELIDVAERRRISLDWLLTGEGEEDRPENYGYSEIAVSELSSFGSGMRTQTEFIRVPVYNVEVAQGHGRLPDDEEVIRHHAYHRHYIEKLGIDPADACVVRMVGDSNADIISDGDHALVDRGDTYIVSGKLYVLRMEGELMAKFLHRVPGGIAAHSYNKAVFPPFTIQEADLAAGTIEVLGRVRDHSHHWD